MAAVLVGLPTYIVAGLVIVPRHPERPSSYSWGEVFTPVAIATLLVAVAAAQLQGRNRMLALLAIPVVAGLLLLVLEVKDSSTSTASARVDEQEQVEVVRSALTAPAQVNGWPRVRNAYVRQQERQIAEGAERMGEDVDAFFASYGRGNRGVGIIGITFLGGEGAGAELQTSPEQGLVDYLAGAGVESSQVLPSGTSGVALRCAPPAPVGVICAWADSSSVAAATWTIPGLGVEEAAELTRTLMNTARTSID